MKFFSFSLFSSLNINHLQTTKTKPNRNDDCFRIQNNSKTEEKKTNQKLNFGREAYIFSFRFHFIYRRKKIKTKGITFPKLLNIQPKKILHIQHPNGKKWTKSTFFKLGLASPLLNSTSSSKKTKQITYTSSVCVREKKP